MKLYLAAAYSRRSELAAYAYKMIFVGYEVTSRWLKRNESDRALTPAGHEAIALEDLEDVSRADALVKRRSWSLYLRERLCRKVCSVRPDRLKWDGRQRDRNKSMLSAGTASVRMS